MISIIKNRKIWFIFSGLLIGASIVSLALYGLRLGIDFTGGSLIEFSFRDNRPSVEELAQTLSGFGDPIVQPVGDQGILVRLPPLTEVAHQELLTKVRETYADADELRFESIGPVIGKELLDRLYRDVDSMVELFKREPSDSRASEET